MTENKPIIIDARQCEWRTGVEHCGDYECMLNKCCDYNCDWYKRRELEQQIQRYKQAIDKIKEIAEDNFYYLDSEKRWVLNKIIQKCEEVNKQERTKNENLETKTI